MPNELTTKQIEEIAFAVLRSHNDDRLWRALTYDSGPYDVTKATLALQDLASSFFRAGLASAPAAPAQAVPLNFDQLQRVMSQHFGGRELTDDEADSAEAFARAIERAHGIAPKAAQENTNG